MSLAEVLEVDDPLSMSTAELGRSITTLARWLAAAESRWLAMLVEFDRREGWFADDASLSCVDWLVNHCGMSRRTARDKLRVGRELERRPMLAEALSAGDVSYSMVRAMTRITEPDADTDRFLLKLAAKGTVADLERVAQRWADLAEQERGVDDYLERCDRRAMHSSRTYDGMMVLEIVVPVEEGEELLSLLEAGGSREPHFTTDSGGTDGSDAISTTVGAEGGSREPRLSTSTRVDRLMDMLRAARAAGPAAAGAERYTLHLVADLEAVAGGAGLAELLDGTPVSMNTLRRISCDSAIVRHLLRGESEPLDLGRRTSVWNTAQRRAIGLRDGGHCRWPGCRLRIVDVHHIVHWGDDGPTDIANGMNACGGHHDAIHRHGFSVVGDANAELAFYSPDGRLIGTSSPVDRSASLSSVAV